MLSSLSRETDNNPGNCFLGIPILPPILFVISIKPTAQEDLVVYFFQISTNVRILLMFAQSTLGAKIVLELSAANAKLGFLT